MTTTPARAVSGAAIVIVTVAAMCACGPGAPYGPNNPPPEFAIHYTVNATAIRTMWGGSTINGSYIIDLVDHNYSTTGQTRYFDRFMSFGYWHEIEDARWPARWFMQATWGCGEGSSTIVDVRRKIIEAQCTASTINIGVNPQGYLGSAPPAKLTLAFQAGAGLPVEIWLVNPYTQSVISGPHSRTLDGNGATQVPAPSLGSGTYYVLAESPYQGPQIEGAVGEFTIWNTGPPPPPPPPPGCDDGLHPGERLYAGQSISSCDNRYTLAYQGDSNFVFYDGGTPIWATMVFDNPGYVEMQGDGNLVVYNSTTQPIWDSSTGGNGGSVARVQTDGRLVIYRADNVPIWAVP